MSDGNGNGPNGNNPSNTIRGEIVITIDKDNAVGMGVNGDLSTDDIVLMLAKAKIYVDAQMIEKISMAKALDAARQQASKIQPATGVPGPCPGSMPRKRF